MLDVNELKRERMKKIEIKHLLIFNLLLMGCLWSNVSHAAVSAAAPCNKPYDCKSASQELISAWEESKTTLYNISGIYFDTHIKTRLFDECKMGNRTILFVHSDYLVNWAKIPLCDSFIVSGDEYPKILWYNFKREEEREYCLAYPKDYKDIPNHFGCKSKRKLQEINSLISKKSAIGLIKSECSPSIDEIHGPYLSDEGRIMLEGIHVGWHKPLKGNACPSAVIDLETGKIIECDLERSCFGEFQE